jgi:acyl-CoA synthetase (NDP forming)
VEQTELVVFDAFAHGRTLPTTDAWRQRQTFPPPQSCGGEYRRRVSPYQTSPEDLRALLSPRQIAVVGASEDPTRLSGRLVPILLQHGYAGDIYPVNPRHQRVNGLPAYPSIVDVPGPVDTVAVAVRAALVPEVVRGCAAAGVRSAVILSSGFAEEGKKGRRVEEDLAATARASGMPVLGPNAEGFFNVHDGVPLSFSPTVDYDRGLTSVLPGNVAVVSQSGGLGFALFSSGQAVGMGSSYVVSTGNECDLGTLDIVGYLLEDPATDVIAMLIEGFRPGERLAPVGLRAAELGKQLVVAKLGRSAAGGQAAAAHTAHQAGDDEEYQEAFRRFGVIRIDDQEDLLDACFALSRGRRSAGRNVGILTTSGGAGVWLADACDAAGLTVPELGADVQAALRPLMPSYGSPRNPVDVTAEVVSRAGVARPLEMLVSSPQIDAVVLASSLAGPQILERELEDIRGVVASTAKPVVVYSYTHPGLASVEVLVRAGLAWYPSPARTARALCVLLDGRAP